MEEEQKQNTQQAKEEHTATSPKHMSIRRRYFSKRLL